MDEFGRELTAVATTMFPGFGYIAPVESDKVPQAGVLGALRGGAAQASGLFQRFALFRRNKVALLGAVGTLAAFVVYLVVSSSIHARHLREAAAAVEDPNGMTLWAGTSFREARTGRAADIVAGLAAAY